jgi:ribosomal protein S18 acetylase RimI-like enzyme
MVTSKARTDSTRSYNVVSEHRLLLRPICDDDLPFLNLLYHSTREDEVALVDWPEQQKEDFLNMQFYAQHKHYTKSYVNGDFDIILLDGEPVGRLYLDRREDEIRIVDITLLPAYRGKGTGSRCLDDIMTEAKEKEIPIRIHVESSNPALRFYERLGFEHVDTNGVYHLMECLPA